MKATRLDVLEQQTIGEGGFLKLRRLRLKNIRSDGTSSDAYTCDYVLRNKNNNDAVVVVLYRLLGNKIEILLRRGIRPALSTGRSKNGLVVEEKPMPIYFTEVVAGVLELEDKGEKGLLHRAKAEVFEEAGYEISLGDLRFLGAPSFPAPAVIPEKLFLFAAEIKKWHQKEKPSGDGSPMEEGAEVFWLGLDEALQKFHRGEYQDMKSELMCHRLKNDVRI